MNEHSLRLSLAGLPIPTIRYFDQIGSTNDEALEWAEADARDGALVVADTQMNGRGRLGRKWVTEAGMGLAFSLILRPAPWEIERIGLLSPLGALAVSQALEMGYGLTPQIKWPNDVLLNGLKVCGILLEASWLGDRLQAVVIGIGINVMQKAVPPPETLLFPATSLEEATGQPVAREELLRLTLQALFDWRQRIASDQFLQAWGKRLAYLGEGVRVENGGGDALSGTVLGVDRIGNLRLRAATGEEIRVTAGDVHLRPAEDL